MSWTFYLDCYSNLSQAELDFLQEVQCTETLPLKQFAVFCFPADKMNQTVAVKVSLKSQMQQSFKRLFNNLLFVSFGGNGCRRHSQVDPQQKTLWGGLLALSHCVTHIVTHHIRDCVTDDGAPRDREGTGGDNHRPALSHLGQCDEWRSIKLVWEGGTMCDNLGDGD